jgi:heme exporter protein D
MMDDFEKQIKEALAKQDPSPFFEARVLGAVKRQARERRASSRMWWASAVAALLLMITGSVWQHQRDLREEAAGKEAKARLELALKITSVKLQRISQKVEGI